MDTQLPKVIRVKFFGDIVSSSSEDITRGLRILLNVNFTLIKTFFFLVFPRISLHPGPLYAIEGSNFTFPSCSVIGHPSPVVTWRKLSGTLPQERVHYNNSSLQIANVRKDDSDTYFCSAVNLLGTTEKRTLLVVVSLPRFLIKPPARVVVTDTDALSLNCSATGDPKPVVRWKKQGEQLPAGRSLQTNGVLFLRDIKISDKGFYSCVATSAGVFEAETVTYIDICKLK